jgi:formate dehydrogenase subunit gamma
MATASRAARPRRIARFSRTERALHWLLAGSFFVLLGSGLALYLPSLANVVDRPTAKAWHLDAAVVLGVGLVVLLLIGDRRVVRRSLRELDRYDADDGRWLKGAPNRVLFGDPAPPQGRFNAGQKINASLVSGLMVVMAITGFLLWEGERDTRFRFAGTVVVHDWGTLLLILLVCGHLYLAVINPSTRASLRGMTLGDVDREWARRHHPRWVEAEERSSAQLGLESRREPVLDQAEPAAEEALVQQRAPRDDG